MQLNDDELNEVIDGVARVWTTGDATPGFKARVLARIEATGTRSSKVWPWLVVAAAAVIALIVASTAKHAPAPAKFPSNGPHAAATAPSPSVATALSNKLLPAQTRQGDPMRSTRSVALRRAAAVLLEPLPDVQAAFTIDPLTTDPIEIAPLGVASLPAPDPIVIEQLTVPLIEIRALDDPELPAQ
jgi:hypothetical protein